MGKRGVSLGNRDFSGTYFPFAESLAAAMQRIQPLVARLADKLNVVFATTIVVTLSHDSDDNGLHEAI